MGEDAAHIFNKINQWDNLCAAFKFIIIGGRAFHILLTTFDLHYFKSHRLFAQMY